MSNNIHLNASLGLVKIGIGGIITFIAGIVIYQQSLFASGWYTETETAFTWKWSWEDLYFLALGSLYILTGGGLMARARWSHKAASSVGVFAFLGWTYIIYQNFSFITMDRSDYWLELGLSGMIYGLIICGWLFIGNEKVKQELTESEQDFWDNEILDA